MTQPAAYDFTRYLDAKRAVDDRALNVHVWNTLTEHLQRRANGDACLTLLEIGAGTGSMIERMARAGLLSAAHYIALEASEQSVRVGIDRVRAWAQSRGLRCEIDGDSRTLSIVGSTGAAKVDVLIEWVTADVFAWLPGEVESRSFDLVLAHAFLDLVDAPRLLRLLGGVTHSGALFYFSLNFDGATILLPEFGGGVDDLIEQLYHASMDARRLDGHPAGDSRTGRRLFAWMREAGIEVTAAGSSDWVVHAEGGAYSGDAAYFLYHILHFFETSLAAAPTLEAGLLDKWLAARRAQIERGELVYIAHQLDLLGARI